MANKAIQKVFLVSMFFALSNFASAAPEISSTNGDFTHGQNVTVLGSGFGAKVAPAPVVYDEFERSTLTTSATIGTWSSVNNMNSSMSYGRNISSTYAAHKNFVGYDTGGVGVGGASRRWFVNFWVYFDSNFDWGTSSDGVNGQDKMLSNIKFPVRFWKGSGEANIYNSLGWGLDSRAYNNLEFSPDDGAYFSDTTLTKNGLTKGYWHQFSQEFVDVSIANANDCEWRLWWNGKLIFERTGFACNDTNEYRHPLFIGFYNAWGPPMDSAPNDYYMDDVYVDTTLQRIELCDNVNRLSATHCEVQLPTVWDDASVTFTVKTGSFVDGQSWLFIFDDIGNTNVNGFPITIGSSSSDTTPPAFPAGLLVM